MMDDATLLAAFRAQCTRTTLTAISQVTGIHRNTLTRLQSADNLSSATKRRLLRWLTPPPSAAQVSAGFLAGASVLTLGATYGLTQVRVEAMLREALLAAYGEKTAQDAPGSSQQGRG